MAFAFYKIETTCGKLLRFGTHNCAIGGPVSLKVAPNEKFTFISAEEYETLLKTIKTNQEFHRQIFENEIKAML